MKAAEIGRYAYGKHTDGGFVQPRALYREVITGIGKEHPVTSIASHVKAGAEAGNNAAGDRVPGQRAPRHPGAQAAKQLTGS